MTDKTLGQVAYEAWASVTWGSVEEAGEYDETAVSSRDGWQAAAEAVAEQTTQDNNEASLAAWTKREEREKAVIEAAEAQEKAYAKYVDGGGENGPNADLHEYRLACGRTNVVVHALQEARE